jgi:hypothetical protein
MTPRADLLATAQPGWASSAGVVVPVVDADVLGMVDAVELLDQRAVPLPAASSAAANT